MAGPNDSRNFSMNHDTRAVRIKKLVDYLNSCVLHLIWKENF